MKVHKMGKSGDERAEMCGVKCGGVGHGDCLQGFEDFDGWVGEQGIEEFECGEVGHGVAELVKRDSFASQLKFIAEFFLEVGFAL